MAAEFELYVHPDQTKGILGPELEGRLREAGVLERSYAADDDYVSQLMKNPQDYPHELRGRTVVLWGSKGQKEGHPDEVAALQWVNRRVHMGWRTVEREFNNYHPALLKPAA